MRTIPTRSISTVAMRRGASMMLLLGLATGAVNLAAPAAQAAAPAGLSVSTSDGVLRTSSNAKLTYTATVTNAGTYKIKGRLVLSVPAYATYGKAADAKLDKTSATWRSPWRPARASPRPPMSSSEPSPRARCGSPPWRACTSVTHPTSWSSAPRMPTPSTV